jgi:hypothetical protein
MSFLLDSDICSAYLGRPGALFHRFMQHAGYGFPLLRKRISTPGPTSRMIRR